MKVYIEVPDNWIDAESPILWASLTIRDQMKNVLIDAVTKQLIARMPLPEIAISTEEIRKAVKDHMVSVMADRALKQMSHMHDEDTSSPGF